MNGRNIEISIMKVVSGEGELLYRDFEIRAETTILPREESKYLKSNFSARKRKRRCVSFE